MSREHAEAPFSILPGKKINGIPISYSYCSWPKEQKNTRLTFLKKVIFQVLLPPLAFLLDRMDVTSNKGLRIKTYRKNLHLLTMLPKRNKNICVDVGWRKMRRR